MNVLNNAALADSSGCPPKCLLCRVIFENLDFTILSFIFYRSTIIIYIIFIPERLGAVLSFWIFANKGRDKDILTV